MGTAQQQVPNANPALTSRSEYRIRIGEGAKVTRYDALNFKTTTQINRVDYHRVAEYTTYGGQPFFTFGSGKSAFFWIAAADISEWESV